MRQRHAFTLSELMVVIAIIALIAAMVLPSFTGAFQVARTSMCANHLRRISEATQTWATQGHCTNLEVLTSGGWTGAVVKYAGGKECLMCPEGGKLVEGSSIESQIIIRTSPTSGVGIPLIPLVDGGGYKILKLSQTQWSSGFRESARQSPVPYVADNNPDVYWWGYDDGAIGSGDYDFQDLAIRVTKNGDGTATLFICGETAGKPEIWSPDFKTKYAGWEEINGYHDHSVKGKTITLNVGGGSHYGMNLARLDMGRPDKIQALDYLNTTAVCTDDWDQTKWDEDENARPDFLRHGGRANVLFLGGSVRLLSRDEIDPVDVAVERKYWQP